MKKIITAIIIIAMFSLPAQAAFVRPGEKEKTVTPSPTPEQQTGQATAALEEFRSLSRQERRERIREMRHTLKEMRDHPDETATSTVLLVILAVLLPPLAVGLYEKRLSSKFWISLLLTLLFWIPGVVYAILVVLGVA